MMQHLFLNSSIHTTASLLLIHHQHQFEFLFPSFNWHWCTYNLCFLLSVTMQLLRIVHLHGAASKQSMTGGQHNEIIPREEDTNKTNTLIHQSSTCFLVSLAVLSLCNRQVVGKSKPRLLSSCWHNWIVRAAVVIVELESLTKSMSLRKYASRTPWAIKPTKWISGRHKLPNSFDMAMLRGQRVFTWHWWPG